MFISLPAKSPQTSLEVSVQTNTANLLEKQTFLLVTPPRQGTKCGTKYCFLRNERGEGLGGGRYFADTTAKQTSALSAAQMLL